MVNALPAENLQLMESLKKSAAGVHKIAQNVSEPLVTEAVDYVYEYYRLKKRIHTLHKAKGRYHTQHALVDLFESVGLAGERPVNVNQEKEIKNGFESK